MDTYALLKALFGKLFFYLYRVKCEGFHHLPEGGAVLVPNHHSFLDAPLLRAAFTCLFLGRHTLFRRGWRLLSAHVYPIHGGHNL